jgi:hypothetical protein
MADADALGAGAVGALSREALSRELRDLAALLALPAMWVDHAPADIAAGLLRVLFGVLRLESGYAHAALLLPAAVDDDVPQAGARRGRGNRRLGDALQRCRAGADPPPRSGADGGAFHTVSRSAYPPRGIGPLPPVGVPRSDANANGTNRKRAPPLPPGYG